MLLNIKCQIIPLVEEAYPFKKGIVIIRKVASQCQHTITLINIIN